jgi:hypothetical protein
VDNFSTQKAVIEFRSFLRFLKTTIARGLLQLARTGGRPLELPRFLKRTSLVLFFNFYFFRTSDPSERFTVSLLPRDLNESFMRDKTVEEKKIIRSMKSRKTRFVKNGMLRVDAGARRR